MTTHVTVWDIDNDLNWTPRGEPRQPWEQMPAEVADRSLARARELGETASELEYTFADRTGQPVRVILHKTRPEEHQAEDLGAVYEYTETAA